MATPDQPALLNVDASVAYFIINAVLEDAWLEVGDFGLHRNRLTAINNLLQASGYHAGK